MEIQAVSLPVQQKPTVITASPAVVPPIPMIFGCIRLDTVVMVLTCATLIENIIELSVLQSSSLSFFFLWARWAIIFCPVLSFYGAYKKNATILRLYVSWIMANLILGFGDFYTSYLKYWPRDITSKMIRGVVLYSLGLFLALIVASWVVHLTFKYISWVEYTKPTVYVQQQVMLAQVPNQNMNIAIQGGVPMTQQYPIQQYPIQQYPIQQYPVQQYSTQQYSTQPVHFASESQQVPNSGQSVVQHSYLTNGSTLPV